MDEVAAVVIEDEHVGVARARWCNEPAWLVGVDLSSGSFAVGVEVVTFRGWWVGLWWAHVRWRSSCSAVFGSVTLAIGSVGFAVGTSGGITFVEHLFLRFW